MSACAIDQPVADALAQHAFVVFNLSGGKDSGAAALAVTRHLDRIGHPRDRRLAIHADLGRAEWRETEATVERQARHVGAPLTVVRRKAGDMVDRWEQRFTNGKARYASLSTYNLIGPWSSAALRFCTSELKAQVIGPHVARELRGQRVVQVVGIRREESSNRQRTPISKPDHRYAKPGNKAGTDMLMWHPLVDWSTEQVFDYHAVEGLGLHPAYDAGCSRVSCAFCIMQSVKDSQAAASVAGNLDLYRKLVAMEADSSFSFWPDRWLADVAPHLLDADLIERVSAGKFNAKMRQSIEATMPAGLRYVAGWPVRVPTLDEAWEIADARATILAMHGLPDLYPTPQSVVDRFAELMALKDARAN